MRSTAEVFVSFGDTVFQTWQLPRCLAHKTTQAQPTIFFKKTGEFSQTSIRPGVLVDESFSKKSIRPGVLVDESFPQKSIRPGVLVDESFPQKYGAHQTSG
jgi:hypothetical protein